MTTAHAGWYPDPTRVNTQRYWDGASWTDNIAPSASPLATTSQFSLTLPTYSATAPKNPVLSLAVSLLVPGVGSMMNGDVNRGIIILVGFFVSILLTLVLVGFIGVIGFFVWGLVDAYQGALRWNRAHGYETY